MSFRFRGYLMRLNRIDEDRRYRGSILGEITNVRIPTAPIYEVTIRCHDLTMDFRTIDEVGEIYGHDNRIERRLDTPEARAFWGEPEPTASHFGVEEARASPVRLMLREQQLYCAWAGAMITVLVCLGQLAAERAPPSRTNRFQNLEVD